MSPWAYSRVTAITPASRAIVPCDWTGTQKAEGKRCWLVCRSLKDCALRGQLKKGKRFGRSQFELLKGWLFLVASQWLLLKDSAERLIMPRQLGRC